MSSCEALRTTTADGSAMSRRRSWSCGIPRMTVPTAGPSADCTTTASPADNGVTSAAGVSGSRASSASSGRRNVWVRPTGANLTLTNGRTAPALMSLLWARRPAPRLYLERDPVRHDLRTGVALECRDRLVDRRKRPDRAIPVERPHEPAEKRLHVGVGETPLV